MSPIDGTVITKPVEVGELVGPQNNIAEIADFQSMFVETDVPEARLYLIKPGSPCEIALDAYPGKRYRGRHVRDRPAGRPRQGDRQGEGEVRRPHGGRAPRHVGAHQLPLRKR